MTGCFQRHYNSGIKPVRLGLSASHGHQIGLRVQNICVNEVPEDISENNETVEKGGKKVEESSPFTFWRE